MTPLAIGLMAKRGRVYKYLVSVKERQFIYCIHALFEPNYYFILGLSPNLIGPFFGRENEQKKYKMIKYDKTSLD